MAAKKTAKKTVGSRAKWEKAFDSAYSKASKGTKDGMDSIVGKKGQALTKKVTAEVNKKLGYTEAQATKKMYADDKKKKSKKK